MFLAGVGPGGLVLVMVFRGLLWMGVMENLTCLLAGRLESLVLHGMRGLETEALGLGVVVLSQFVGSTCDLSCSSCQSSSAVIGPG